MRTRDVKSVASRARGPWMRLGSVKPAVVAYSTIMRAGRSARLQTIAPSAMTSPDCTLCRSCGRDVAVWAKMRVGKVAARALALRNLRRLILRMGAVYAHRHPERSEGP